MIAAGRDQEETPRSTYPLTSLQQGMLFHYLLEPHSGVYVEQQVLALPEAIDATLMRRAWEIVARRHDVLRTSFRWHEADRPLQDVWTSVELPFREEDWRGLTAAESETALHDFLRADRRAGFALDRAPLSRVALFRVGERDYRMVWTFHHAVIDGRSFFLVWQYVLAAYEALERGEEPDASTAVPSFGDHVAALQLRDGGSSEAYWRRRLEGVHAPTALPTAFIDADAAAAQRHGERHVVLSATATAALERFARDNGLTLNTVLQGAWALLLARHSGESEVVFGATRAGRRSTIADADDVVGLFINTLPVRVGAAPDRPLLDMLADLRRDWTEMRDHEQTPLPQVQRWSEIPSGLPLFESIFVYDNELLDTRLRALGGRWAQRSIRLFEQTNFPLTAALYGGRELTVKLQYDRTRLDDATIERVLSHYATLLAGIAASEPGCTLGDLPWLAGDERRLVVETWNATTTEYPRDATVPALFAARAAAAPDAIALVQGERTLRYGELDERANRLAHRLQRLGVGPDVPVGLCIGRSIEMVVGALAVLKAGGAYVPLDPSYPRERIRFMVEDTGLPVLLTESSLVGALPAGPQILRLDDDWPSIATEPASAPACGAYPEGAANIIFTSGSTGVPKGVLVTHRGVVRLVVGTTYAHYGPDEVMLAVATLSFDASTFELWGALLNGGRLVLLEASPPTLDDIADAIEAHEATMMLLTAALFHQMVDHRLDALRPLHTLFAGGDVVSVTHAQRVAREIPSIRMINAYGPTENAVITTCFDVTRDWNAAETATTLPIGKPISNTTVYVLDAARRPVPIGVTGRLYTGGDGVARGYHDRAELTAERFVPDPFDSRAGARMYDTGDRARWRPDGTLDFVGRIDQQVKIRGFRVEPGEIETALMQHPAVREAVVVVAGDGAARRLVAYAVPQPGIALDVDALRAFLLERLPVYLVPAFIVALAELPITSNGKVDRLRLPDPGATDGTDHLRYVAPRTDTERVLARIWAEILGLERVGVCDNFFELGGDSILTIALVSRARDGGLRVTPRQLYDHPTVAELAGAAVPVARFDDQAAAVTGPAPLTPIQRWFFEGERDELNYWNQTFLFASAVPLDSAALASAVQSVVAHHDALRLRFAREGTDWTQRFAEPDAGVPLDTVDLSNVPDAALSGAIEAACVAAQSSLDIARGPLLRALHLSLGERGARLLLAVHHLAIDGVSWRLLLEDLETAYDAALQGRSPALPPKTTSFQGWAQRLVAHAGAGGFDEQRAYWRDVVGTPSRRLPRDTAAAYEDVEADARTLTLTLTADETRILLQRVPAAYNTRINDVLVAALSRALRRWAGPGPLLIHLEGHGREDLFDGVDLSRTVGWFTALFPVRLALADVPALDELLAIKEQLRGIPQHGLGYGVLRQIAGDPVLAAASPAELVFNYLGQFDRSVSGSQLFDFAPESYGPWHGPRARRRHAIEINALVIDGRLELRWSFGKIHHAATMARVANDFVAALRELIEVCTAPGAGRYTPSDFPLARLDQPGLDRIVGETRDIEDVYPLTPIQQLFHLFADPLDDPGFEQWRYRVRGPLDEAALRGAWQTVVGRHAILRTAFVSDGLAEPLQVVHARADLAWAEHDVSDLAEADRDSAIARILDDDRARGFDFTRAPLMRVTLIRVAHQVVDVVWSQHHLLTDRWSFPILLREVQSLYERSTGGVAPPLDPPVPYRAYIDWLGRQDVDAAQGFWRDLLDGYVPPLPFTPPAGVEGGGAAEIRADFTAAQSAALHAYARAHQIPVNTAITGAWAIWLAHHTAASDVVLGLSVSGRPADLAQADRIVGVMVNNLPLRARLEPSDELTAWLRTLQAQALDVQQYAFTPPTRVQEWSGVPWGRRLFDTFLVFHHASADAESTTWLGPELAIEQLHAPTRTAYPLTLVVAGDDVVSLRMTYDTRTFDRETVGRALDAVRAILVAMADGPVRVGDLLAILPAGERGAGVAERKRTRPAGEPFVAPRSAAETVVAQIWRDLLDVDEIGVNDNFLALGGQSLLAMQVVSRVRDRFQIEAPVRELFRGPTVARFTQALIARERKPGAVERIAQLVQRVAAMSLEELRLAAAAQTASRGESERTDGG